jgi:hypothetical protein
VDNQFQIIPVVVVDMADIVHRDSFASVDLQYAVPDVSEIVYIGECADGWMDNIINLFLISGQRCSQ